MDPKRIEEYHASRPLPDKAFRSSCYAAHVSMYFDTLGNVLACCQNTKYPVGNVLNERLRDIWHGPKIQKLRTALEKDRFGAGCQFCEWQISVGNYVNAFTRNFDQFPVTSREPDWPRMMEFSVSNTCNLECIMCIGTLSSSIRARREGLPPLPKAYGEQFFEDLRPFLPHLEFAKFLGGEPFLAAESFRIWDLMHEEKAHVLCNVTTNGTQWNERVEKVLERFPISICISMDGTTPQTVEGIRVNAKFDLVHENFRRFHRYCRARKTDITLTYCLMRQNWHEFGDYLLFADEWDCDVCVNLVREPAHCSLYTLPVEELALIADQLEKRSATYLPKLGRNRRVWFEQLTAIRRRVEHSSESSRSPFATPLALVVLDRHPALDQPDRMTIEKAKSRLADGLGSAPPTLTFAADQDDRVQSFDSPDRTFFGVPTAEAAGQAFEEIVRQMVDRRGPQRTIPIYRTAEYVDRAVLFQNPSGQLEVLRVIAVPKVNEFGMPSGSAAVAGLTAITPEQAERSRLEAARLLDSWCGSSNRSPGSTEPRLRLELDAEGKIVHIEAGGEGLGLRERLRVGMTEAEFDRAMVESWGQKQQIHEEIRPDFEMYSFCHGRAGDIVMVRMVTIPNFRDARHVGFTRELAYTTINPAQAEQSAQEAQQVLQEWAGQGEWVRIHHNRADDITRFDGPLANLLGFDPQRLVGKKGWQIPQALAEHFGHARVFRWELDSHRLDTQVEVADDRGHHLVRMISVPVFNAGGNFQGRVRFVAVSSRKESHLPIAREAIRKDEDPDFPLVSVELHFGLDRRFLASSEPTWLGCDLAEVQGATLDNWDRWLEQKLGTPAVLSWQEKPGWVEVEREYRRPGQWTFVRTIEIPTLSAEGNCTGTTLVCGALAIESALSARLEELVCQKLRQESSSSELVGLEEDHQGRVVKVSGPEGSLALRKSLVGESWLEQVAPGESATHLLSWRRSVARLEESYLVPGEGEIAARIHRSVRVIRVTSPTDQPISLRWVAVETVPWNRSSPEMVQVDQMLDAWKSTGSVYSVALDAEERLVRVSPNLSELGIEPPDVLGLTYSQFRDRLGFGPDHATRTWNADPNQVIDEIDERTEPLPQGTLARRLRRRRTFPSVPGGAFATVEKIAIQQEIYPGFEPALVLVRYPGSPRGDGAPWHEFHPEMAEVDTMLTGWKTMGGVVSLGVDANGRVLFVEDPSSMLGLAPDQLVGLSVDEVRSQMGFAHPQAKRTWQADPGCALDEIDEVAQSIPAGTFCRRLRRRRVPTYRGDLPIEAVEKLAVQEELYKAT